MRISEERSVAGSWPVAAVLKLLLFLHGTLMSITAVLGPRRRSVGEEGADILLTGTFHSENWILSHLEPLARSGGCRNVKVVTHFPVPAIDKVERIIPGRRLSRILGPVPARLVTFFLVALGSRPHAVGGFHLLVNGLVAALLGRVTGARSIYFCVGGPAEVQGGGILSENRLFEKLESPDRRVEADLLRAAARFDLVVTMGSRARDYFREKGVTGDIRVIPGGIDAGRFSGVAGTSRWDVVFVGRLSPVKQVDLLLRALALVKRGMPEIRAVIVGDGPLRPQLEKLSSELGLDGTVVFAGQRADVGAYLAESKVFVLTSKTEGLSLALMEAMMAGVPAVVSDVGDLGDLVRNGENGFLVGEQTPDRFAERISALLMDAEMHKRFSAAARSTMKERETRRVAAQWDAVLRSWRTGQDMRCAG